MKRKKVKKRKNRKRKMNMTMKKKEKKEKEKEKKKKTIIDRGFGSGVLLAVDVQRATEFRLMFYLLRRGKALVT